MEKIIKFGDLEIEKQTYQQHKESIPIKNIDIHKKAISNKASLGKKGLNILLAASIQISTIKKYQKKKPFFVFLKNKNKKAEKIPKKKIKIFLTKKNRKSVSIIVIEIKIFLKK